MKCRIVCRALYDYTATSDEELSFVEGSILLITDDSDVDWWMAIEKSIDTFQETRSGLVPATYVEEMQPFANATALYDYDAASDEEITLREGSFLRVYDTSDEDWWFVKQDDEVGLAPKTYLEVEGGQGPEQVQIAVESPSLPQSPENQPAVDPEEQKNMLMNALGGLGFGPRKSDTRKSVTKGQIHGPNDIQYFSVVELDKKKKKNSRKGLLGVSSIDSAIYFVDDSTHEVIQKIETSQILGWKEKKNKLSIDSSDQETFEFEGEKADIAQLAAKINALQNPNTSSTPIRPPADVAASTSKAMSHSPSVSNVPSAISAGAPPPIAPSPAALSKNMQIAIALYDYDPREEGEMAIREGDKLYVLDAEDPDWTRVRLVAKKGSEGLVPRNYIEIQKPIDPASSSPSAAESKRQKEEELRRIALEQQQQQKALEEEERRRREEEERRRQSQARRDYERELAEKAAAEEVQRRKKEEQEAQERAKAAAAPPRLLPRPTALQSSGAPTIPQGPPAAPPLPPRGGLGGPASPSELAAKGVSHSPSISSVAKQTENRISPVSQSIPSSIPPIPNRPMAPNLPSRPAAVSKSRDQLSSAPKQKSDDKPDPSALRLWTDRTGTFKVEAAFLEVVDSKVHLHKSNGVKISVPIEKLNPGDVEFLRQKTGNASLGSVGAGVAAPLPVPSAGGTKPRSSVGGSMNALSDSNTSEYTFNGFNWRDWLIKIGISSADASEYAKKFVAQKMDQSILTDIDRDALRAMAISEGDIIRIRKATQALTLNPETQKIVSLKEREAEQRNLALLKNTAQIKADEALARELQTQELSRAGTRRVSGPSGSSVGVVNPAMLQQAGKLLQSTATTGAGKQPTPPSSHRGSVSQQATKFVVPPSTAEISNAPTLGLKPSGSGIVSSSAHDPWSSSAKPSQPVGGSSVPSNSLNPAAQESLFKAQQQQEEAQKTLMAAQQAILKAQEQAKQAALLQEQNKAAQMQQAQTQAALARAQETARQAQLIQQQAEQALLNAQKGALNPSMSSSMSMSGAGFGGPAPMGMGMNGTMPLARPQLSAPLIPTPSQPTSGFVPVGSVRPNQPSSQQMMPGNMGGNMNMGMQAGAGFPLRPQMTGSSTTSSDRYSVFKDVNPGGPSIFNSPSPAPSFASSNTSNLSGMGMAGNPNQMIGGLQMQQGYGNTTGMGMNGFQARPNIGMGSMPMGGGMNTMPSSTGMGLQGGMASMGGMGMPGMNSMGMGLQSQQGMMNGGMNTMNPGMGMNPSFGMMNNNPNLGQMNSGNMGMLTPQQLLLLQQQQQQQMRGGQGAFSQNNFPQSQFR